MMISFKIFCGVVCEFFSKAVYLGYTVSRIKQGDQKRENSIYT